MRTSIIHNVLVVFTLISAILAIVCLLQSNIEFTVILAVIFIISFLLTISQFKRNGNKTFHF